LFSFFRINDPYRIVIVFFILLGINLPYLMNGENITIPEIGRMLIGDKIADGNVLYVDLWDNIGPISGWFYYLLDFLFGRSHLAYQLFGIVFIFLQSVLFNNIMLSRKAYNENTYTSALLYALLMSLFFSFAIFSPILLGMTFFLLALDILFDNLDMREKREESLLLVGVYLSLATLCYFPFVVYMVLFMISFAFYTPFTPRRFFLVLYGFLIPILFVGVYYYWKEGFQEFMVNYIYSWFTIPASTYTDLISLVYIVAWPALFLLLGMFKVINTPSFINYQNKLQQIMFYMLLFSFGAFFLARDKSPDLIILFIPAAAFYINHYFLLIRRQLILESVFTLFVVLVIFINLGTYFGFFFTSSLVDMEKFLAGEDPYQELVEGKKILHVGENLNVYQNAQLATPYLNWHLSKMHLEALDYYDNLTQLYLNFKEDPPEVIIDEKNVIDDLFEQLPTIASQYEKLSGREIWVLKTERLE